MLTTAQMSRFLIGYFIAVKVFTSNVYIQLASDWLIGTPLNGTSCNYVTTT